MDTLTIILIVAILILIYVLYAYFTDSSSELVQTASLLTTVPAIENINRPTNTRYGHSVWIYVNTWDNNANKTIISRDNNFKLYLDKSSPVLKLDVHMNDGSDETMIITNNFPLQKWVNISVSMDNQFADTYIDGKLVRSQRFYKQINEDSGVSPKMPPGKEVKLYLGNKDTGNFDAYATLFRRWTEPIDPETAWDNYMKGNGSSKMASALNDVGIDLSILQNNEEIKKFSLL
tara:strand:- start:16476 stop:17174 length:699 start_codon:yes stop_codon:yes gene_type:complete